MVVKYNKGMYSNARDELRREIAGTSLLSTHGSNDWHVAMEDTKTNVTTAIAKLVLLLLLLNGMTCR